MALKLYELSEQYKTLETYLSNPDGEVLFDELKFREQLNKISEAFNIKAENIAKLILSKQAESKALDDEITRLTSRKRSAENKVDWLKDYLQVEMQTANIDKIEGQVLSLSLQKSPPSCVIINQEVIPKIYVKVIPAQEQVDKKSILDHFKDTGEIINGVSIVTDKKNLRIR